MFSKLEYEMALNARRADLERQAEIAKQAVIEAHKEYERICRERDCWPDFNFGGYGVRYDAGISGDNS